LHHCHRVGHLSRSCPSRHPRTVSDKLRHRLTFPPESIHSRFISSSLRSRLCFPPENIHSRIAFPPLRHPSTTNPPPTSSTSPHPAKAATVITWAPQDVCCPSIPEVAYALSQQLHIHHHNIMVGVFVVEFMRASECHAGMENAEPMDRGRPISRSPIGGQRIEERLPSPRS